MWGQWIISRIYTKIEMHRSIIYWNSSHIFFKSLTLLHLKHVLAKKKDKNMFLPLTCKNLDRKNKIKFNLYYI